MPEPTKGLDQLRSYWDKHAHTYDKQMSFMERRFFADTRPWVCRQATGAVLEVAIGTGLNLQWYPRDVRLTGIDFSPVMLERAGQRARQDGRAVELTVGDAQRLPFPDSAFDTVVCTFSLCAVPDDRATVLEMTRVLRPGGLLLLADHVESTSRVLRTAQRLLELVSIPSGGEHQRRRPLVHVQAAGLVIEHTDRFRAGIIERLAARKPDSHEYGRRGYPPAKTQG